MNIDELYKIFCQHPKVTTDSRNCPEGAVFFALKGENFDGNKFARQAIEKGCAYAVVDAIDEKDFLPEKMIRVDNVLLTLQELAAHHRRVLKTPILQITGTNGKTTTKELCAAVLGKKYKVLYTRGNLNNHIGVPLTLLQLTAEHEMAVIETGANHPHEIAELSQIVDPDCGLITNVGRAHLEGFGSFEGVIKTKGELYDYLRQRGGDSFVFIHFDNPYLTKISEKLPLFTYGQEGRGYEVEGSVVECSPFLKLRWRKQGEKGFSEVQTHLIGAYNIDNALAAAAVGVRFGVPVEDISAALAEYSPTNNRSELRTTERNQLIIDAYNANPTSMAAALDNFKLIRHPHKMVVLGGMRELGEVSEREHWRIIEIVRALSLDDVWLVGEEFAPYAQEFTCFPDVEAVKQRLQANPVSGRMVLIKGSNSTRLFQLPDFF